MDFRSLLCSQFVHKLSVKQLLNIFTDTSDSSTIYLFCIGKVNFGVVSQSIKKRLIIAFFFLIFVTQHKQLRRMLAKAILN